MTPCAPEEIKLKMEEWRCSETTLDFFRYTWHHFPEDGVYHTRISSPGKFRINRSLAATRLTQYRYSDSQMLHCQTDWYHNLQKGVGRAIWNALRLFLPQIHWLFNDAVSSLCTQSQEVKAVQEQARCGPEGSRRFRLPDFMTFGTWRWWGCQPHAPAAFTPRNVPGTHFH